MHFAASAPASTDLATAASPAAAPYEGARVDPHDLAPTWGLFNVAFDTKLGYFPWLGRPENKARLARFGKAVTGTRQWEVYSDEILRGA